VVSCTRLCTKLVATGSLGDLSATYGGTAGEGSHGDPQQGVGTERIATGPSGGLSVTHQDNTQYEHMWEEALEAAQSRSENGADDATVRGIAVKIYRFQKKRYKAKKKGS